MKGVIILAIGLVITGLITSFFLIPSANELALLQFKDKKFADAKDMYETQIKNGDLSISVVIPLSKLYLQYGNINKAVDLMEKFVKMHPRNIMALERLGKYYHYAQRPYDYQKILETIVSIEPTLKRLFELADIYNFVADYKNQIKILEKIITTFPAEEKGYLDLANLQAAQGQIEAAIETQNRYFKNHPNKINSDVVALKISLEVNAEKYESAKKVALDWLNNHPDPDVASRYSNIFYDKRQTQYAYDVILPLEKKGINNISYLDQITHLEIELKKSKKAFSRLKLLYDQNTLPLELMGTFIELSLLENHADLALEIAKKVDINTLPDWLLSSLIDTAISSKFKPYQEWLHKTIHDDYREQHPVLIGNLAFEVNDIIDANRWADVANSNPGLFVRDKISLVRLLYLLKRYAESLVLLMDVSKYKSVPNELIADLSDLFIKLKKQELGYHFFNKIKDERDSLNIEIAWITLATVTGRTNVVLEWFKTSEKNAIKNQILFDLYYLALDYKQPKVAYEAGIILYERTSGPNERWLLTQALIADKRYKAALVHLRELRDYNNATARAYEDVLFKAYAIGENVYAELKQFLVAKLKISTIIGDQRYYVSKLLELGEKKIALKQLMRLASKAPPKSTDVTTLLYIWGPRPDNASIKWLTGRAYAARGKHQETWLQYLIDFGQPGAAINIIEGIPLEQRSTKMKQQYIDMLVLQNKHKKLKKVLMQMVLLTDAIKALTKWGEIARIYDFLKISEKAYIKILEVDSHHSPTLRSLGLLYYHAGNREMAIAYLEDYHVQSEGDWESYYFLGETYSAVLEDHQAKNAFIIALEKLKNVDKLNKRMKVTKAQILHRMGNVAGSIEAYDELQEDNPNDMGLNADYGAMLIEHNRLNRSKDILDVR